MERKTDTVVLASWQSGGHALMCKLPWTGLGTLTLAVTESAGSWSLTRQPNIRTFVLLPLDLLRLPTHSLRGPPRRDPDTPDLVSELGDHILHPGDSSRESPLSDTLQRPDSSECEKKHEAGGAREGIGAGTKVAPRQN
jgi:hypothetical protein